MYVYHRYISMLLKPNNLKGVHFYYVSFASSYTENLDSDGLKRSMFSRLALGRKRQCLLSSAPFECLRQAQ